MKTEITILYNGKELKIPIEINDEQIHEIYKASKEPGRHTGWEKPERGDTFFYEDALNRVQAAYLNDNESVQTQADLLYESVNCYSSETVAKNISRGDKLHRQLRRFSIDHGGYPVNHVDNGYTIVYNYQNNCVEVGVTGPFMAFGEIIFPTEEAAQAAINKYRTELMWYFNDRISRL